MFCCVQYQEAIPHLIRIQKSRELGGQFDQEVEATQEARLEDIQEATLEATLEMTQKGCTEEGNDQKGKRAAAAVSTEEKEMKITYFLMDNVPLYGKHLMDFTDFNKQEVLFLCSK